MKNILLFSSAFSHASSASIFLKPCAFVSICFPSWFLLFLLAKETKKLEKFFSAVVDQQAALKEKIQASEASLDFFWAACWSTTTKKNLPNFLVSFASKKQRQKNPLFWEQDFAGNLTSAESAFFLCPRYSVWLMIFSSCFVRMDLKTPLTIWFKNLGGGKGQQQEEQHVQEQEQEQDNNNFKKLYIHIQNILKNIKDRFEKYIEHMFKHMFKHR